MKRALGRLRLGLAARWLTGLVALAGLVAAVIWLPGAARPPRPAGLGRPAAGLGTPAGEPITCERTLADEPVTAFGTDPDGDRGPAGRVTASQLIECPTRFDGREVVYVGEVVGDVLERPGGAWVLMNDDAYALELGPLGAHGRHRGYNSGLSVWLDGELARLADEPGRADRRGDVLRVRAVVRRADPADGGGLTLRAFSGELVADAERIPTPVNRPQAVLATGLAVLAVGVVVAERLAARRR